MKKTTIITIVVLVFIVIAVVVYMFMKSNKDAQQITKTTETSGLGTIFANTGGGWLETLFRKNGSRAVQNKLTQEQALAIQMSAQKQVPF